MLGRLARLMRFSGYDVEYDHTADDDTLFKRSRRRMLLTKDRPLAERATLEHCYFVRATGALLQLKEIRKQFPLKKNARPRCLMCNVPIRSIPKTKIKHLVPPYVYSSREEFYICPKCKRAYWHGTHFDHMVRMIE